MKNASRKRVAISWRPEWTPKIETWTAWQIKQNMWRFDRIEEPKDVMQEAKLLFWTLQKKYPVVNQAAHFFALYKTSLYRTFHDKARLMQRSIIDQDKNAEDVAIEMQVEGNLPNCGQLNLLLEEMPDELKLVLRALTTGRVRLKLDRPTKVSRPRENHNMRLKRRFAVASTDPVGDLRGYFANT